MAIPDVDRYRQLLVSLDVDWAKIETNTPLLKALFGPAPIRWTPDKAASTGITGNRNAVLPRP
jgi:hypothetical protein